MLCSISLILIAGMFMGLTVLEAPLIPGSHNLTPGSVGSQPNSGLKKDRTLLP